MRKRKQKILIIDDEKPIREVLGASLEDEGHEVLTARDGQSGLLSIEKNRPSIVLLDIWMPGAIDGIGVLKRFKEMAQNKRISEPEFIVMSGHGTIETAVKATKLGAWDFIEKPISIDKVSILISNISTLRQARDEKKSLLNRLRKDIAIVGDSKSMMNVKKVIARVASSPNWVLLYGSEGSGKCLLAQNCHYLSPRIGASFVELNCAAIPSELLYGELFGYCEQELPGGELRKGKVELAHGGTLYLNNVEHLSLEAQGVLIQILQDGCFNKLEEKFVVDIRIVMATTIDLAEKVAKGEFREDLYQRLALNILEIPDLRDRREDVPVLVLHFNAIFCREGGFLRKNFSKAALQTLVNYEWPGNVRELRNFIERIYILTPGEHVDVHDIRFAGLLDPESLMPPSVGSIAEFTTFRQARAAFEKKYLMQKIKDNGGNISKTAEVIGLERSYLHRKIKSYGIEV